MLVLGPAKPKIGCIRRNCLQPSKAVEFEENGNQINSKTLKHVPFTVSFIKEVLRLSHVLDILIPRQALVDIQLPNGQIMPEGTNYAVDISAMQLSQARSHALWSRISDIVSNFFK